MQARELMAVFPKLWKTSLSTPYLILKMYFNIPKTDGWAPIHLAARYGQTEVVKFFIDNCDIPKPAPGGRNIIHIGALNGK